jgi:hypothetical protein
MKASIRWITDASSHSLSSILYQNLIGVNRVICYASRVLQPIEQHYCSTRLELLAVVFGLKQLRHFLQCRKLVLRMDNAALTSLMRTPEPLAQQVRWLDLLSGFDFCIVHRAGSIMVLPIRWVVDPASGLTSTRCVHSVDPRLLGLIEMTHGPFPAVRRRER